MQGYWFQTSHDIRMLIHSLIEMSHGSSVIVKTGSGFTHHPIQRIHLPVSLLRRPRSSITFCPLSSANESAYSSTSKRSNSWLVLYIQYSSSSSSCQHCWWKTFMGNVIGLILKEKALCSFDMSVGDCFPKRHSFVSATTRIFSISARTSNLAAQNSQLRIQ
jgi:hypothetical protein